MHSDRHMVLRSLQHRMLLLTRLDRLSLCTLVVLKIYLFVSILNHCHAPSWLDPGELSHMHIHLTTDCDLTQLNAPPCVGNVEYSLTRTSPTSTDISGQAGMVC